MCFWFCYCFCGWSGGCGESDHHRLLHAWNDGIWSAQEDQGSYRILCLCFLVWSIDDPLKTIGSKDVRMLVLFKQESTSLRDIPVVIMSSENIPSRINRWEFLWIFVILFHIISWFLKEQIQVKACRNISESLSRSSKTTSSSKRNVSGWQMACSCSANCFMVWKLLES